MKGYVKVNLKERNDNNTLRVRYNDTNCFKKQLLAKTPLTITLCATTKFCGEITPYDIMMKFHSISNDFFLPLITLQYQQIMQLCSSQHSLVKCQHQNDLG